MTVYKVPQDVEAEDKLLGPFSFRQFIYLIVTVMGIAAAWALGNLFIPLAAIPIPIIIFFGALALPLRKDQPMEVYLAAIVSFYLKPRKHLWQPDGSTSFIEITAAKVTEIQRTKDLSQSEAERRLSYLANLVDSGGWASRGVATDSINSSMNTDVYYEAQRAEDVLDTSAAVNQNFNVMIERNDKKHRENIISFMSQQSNPNPAVPAVSAQPIAPADNIFTSFTPTTSTTLNYNPYPDSINQFVIQPLSQQTTTVTPPLVRPQPTSRPAITPVTTQQATPLSTSIKAVSPDIINLASQNDLSIETIAREANRIAQRELESQEVFVPLR